MFFDQHVQTWKKAVKSVKLQDARSARRLVSQEARNECPVINMFKPRKRLVEGWDGRQVRRVLQVQEDQGSRSERCMRTGISNHFNAPTRSSLHFRRYHLREGVVLRSELMVVYKQLLPLKALFRQYPR